MKHNMLAHESIAHNHNNCACGEIKYSSNIRARGAPYQSSPYLYIHIIILWSILLSCGETQSFIHDQGGSSFTLSRNFLADTLKLRRLQSVPTSSPLKIYAARRINAGGEIEYIDSNGISWGADKWYGNTGRRTSPSECTANIINTTDDILYCSNRFYPTSIVDPPYRYNSPLPYAALYEIRLHFAEVVR